MTTTQPTTSALHNDDIVLTRSQRHTYIEYVQTRNSVIVLIVLCFLLSLVLSIFTIVYNVIYERPDNWFMWPLWIFYAIAISIGLSKATDLYKRYKQLHLELYPAQKLLDESRVGFGSHSTGGANHQMTMADAHREDHTFERPSRVSLSLARELHQQVDEDVELSSKARKEYRENLILGNRRNN